MSSNTTNNREQYRGFLKGGICKVTFTKVNGETRVMRCTLNEAFIPAVQVPPTLDEQKEASERSLEVLRVFDVEAQGWRSFRIDSVSDFQVGA